jgi:Icc-related predicted phosphoesterase
VIRRLDIDLRPADHARPPAGLTLLAVSDEPEPALDRPEVRQQIGRPNLIVGCGDLEAPYLAMLADALVAPLLFVRGNHDRGGTWDVRSHDLPDPLPDARPIHFGSMAIVGLSWPGELRGRAIHDDRAAWGQVFRLTPRLLGRKQPLVVVSHVPPAGLGDVQADRYHRGFKAYRWLVDRLHPALWLHGHVHPATQVGPLVLSTPLPIVNVTGAVLVRLTI